MSVHAKLPVKGGEIMKSQEIITFEQNVKHTLDWANWNSINPCLRSVLESLMQNVSELAQAIQK